MVSDILCSFGIAGLQPGDKQAAIEAAQREAAASRRGSGVIMVSECGWLPEETKLIAYAHEREDRHRVSGRRVIVILEGACHCIAAYARAS